MFKSIIFRFIKYLLIKFCHRLIIEIVLDKFSDQEKKELVEKLTKEKYL
jgi:hypothetical protein